MPPAPASPEAGAIFITADIARRRIPRGSRTRLGNNKNNFAANSANSAKATTARQVNGEETANCAKTAKKRHSLSLLFLRPGRFLLSPVNVFSSFA